MRRSGYARNRGLYQRGWCDLCECTRFVSILEPWQTCTGIGQNSRVQCGVCGHAFTIWKDCLHRIGEYGCEFGINATFPPKPSE